MPRMLEIAFLNFKFQVFLGEKLPSYPLVESDLTALISQPPVLPPATACKNLLKALQLGAFLLSDRLVFGN